MAKDYARGFSDAMNQNQGAMPPAQQVFNDRRPSAFGTPRGGEPDGPQHPVPKTKAQIHQHLVDHHGHDDFSDNPEMRRWKLADYQDQHDEAHTGLWGAEAGHSHG